MKKLIVLACILLLLAPARWGIALNRQTRECAGYWAGDEYMNYTLPQGWEAYYPDDQGIIQTGDGSCEWRSTDVEKRAEECCKALGYSYVSSNIGRGKVTLLSMLVLGVPVCAGCIILLALVGILVLGGYLLRRRRLSTRPQ